jgi:ubiquinol-cytochrome c reductase cytochrome b subunit
MAAHRMMSRRGARFFDERFGSNAAVRFVMTKVFPDHWSFYLGEFSLYAFLMLVATGIWLTFVYVATPAGAYASVASLSRADPVGYLMRQVHHWSAVTFVAAILLHMSRIFFTAAYRAPRELNWIVGFTMLVVASLTGFTGYSLPDDALAGTGLRITDAVLRSIPFVGGWAADVLNGGGYPGPDLLPHLYTFHVYFLPVTIAVLLSLHLGMVVFQKHTQFVDDPQHVVGRRFWPDYALRTVAALAFSVGVIIALAGTVEINPIERFGPYHDWTVPNPATPDWYAAFLDGALRLGPTWQITIAGHPIPAVFWPGIVMPTVVLAVFYCWPFIDAWLTRDHRLHDVLVPATHAPWRVGVGTAFIAAGFFLTLAASDDQQAATLHVSVAGLVTFYRIAVPVGSVLIGIVAAQIARELRLRRERHGIEAERVVQLRRTADGGYREEAVRP